MRFDGGVVDNENGRVGMAGRWLHVGALCRLLRLACCKLANYASIVDDDDERRVYEDDDENERKKRFLMHLLVWRDVAVCKARKRFVCCRRWHQRDFHLSRVGRVRTRIETNDFNCNVRSQTQMLKITYFN